MNPEKVGQFIKKLRQTNNLTQKDLADKYNVSYQAVSKWENGKNLPDILLLRQMSKDFNINIEDLLDGEYISNKKEGIKRIIASFVLFIILIILVVVINIFNNKSFNFRTISSLCSDFNVNGSIAYDDSKSSIYISDINYNGCDKDITYKSIECNLYEKSNNIDVEISKCEKKENINLDDYLKSVKLNVDNYYQKCKTYDNNLILKIIAQDNNNKEVVYEIPLNLNDNC